MDSFLNPIAKAKATLQLFFFSCGIDCESSIIIESMLKPANTRNL